MKARLRQWLVPIIGSTFISMAVAFEWLFNGPSIFVRYEASPLVVMDDFHGLQVGLVLFQGYGPSRYSGGYTDLGFEGHTLCTVPFSGFTVLFFLAGTITLVVGILWKFLRHEKVSG